MKTRPNERKKLTGKTRATEDRLTEAHEATVLGFLLENPARIPEYAWIGPELFAHEKNRLILNAIASLHAEGVAITFLSVGDRLKRERNLSAAGGEAYLGTLAVTFARNSTYTMAYALDELRCHAERRGLGELARRIEGGELLSASDVASEVERVRDATQPGSGLTIRSAASIIEMDLDENDCLMGDRILAKGQPLVIAGAGGIGKSRLLLQLAACCMTGRDWCGFPTRAQGLRWLILQTENSNRRLQGDLLYLKRWCGNDWPKVSETLYLHTLETDRDGVLTLADPSIVARLHRVIQDIKPDIVAIDPLRDLIAGDPNSDADMAASLSAIGAICRRGNKQRTIVILHHALTGKLGAAKASGFDRTSFARNSKVLAGWTRGQINVAPGGPDNNETLVLTCGKNSNGKEFPQFALRLNTSTMVYEPDDLFDLGDWHAQVSSASNVKRKTFTPTIVKDLLNGSVLSKPLLAKAIAAEAGCGRSRAYELISEAEEAGSIKRDRATNNYAIAA